MNDLKKESYYLNKMAVLTKSTEHYRLYSILPAYGVGRFIIFDIIPGLGLSFNNFITKNSTIINTQEKYKFFSQPILKINYCLQGKMMAYDQQGKICISNKNSTAYYVGTDNISSVIHYKKNYQSLTLFGYVNQIADIFEKIFFVKRSICFDFFQSICDETKILVLMTEANVIRLVNEIKHALRDNEHHKIRLKTIELFLYELENFEKNKHRKEIYYNRTIVEKIKTIQSYIMNNLDEKITINQLCDDFKISRDTLKRCFKQMFSISIYAYIKRSRMAKGKALLESSEKGITEIALICGYSNHHSFSKAFKDHYKITPREVRKVYVINDYHQSIEYQK